MLSKDIILEEIREAYSVKDYYQVKSLLKNSGWLLTRDKYQAIIEALEYIKPTELIEYANKKLR